MNESYVCIFPALIRGPGKVRRLAKGSGLKLVIYGRQEGAGHWHSHTRDYLASLLFNKQYICDFPVISFFLTSFPALLNKVLFLLVFKFRFYSYTVKSQH